MTDIFLKILNMSINAGWLILAVMAVRLLLRKAPKNIILVMWALVGVRLLFPFSLESIFSLMPSGETVPSYIVYSQYPAIDSGIPVVNNVINEGVLATFRPQQPCSINPLQVVLAVAAFIWTCGMAGMLIYTIISYVRVKRKVTEAAWWKENIWICDRVETPFILGVCRPRIYLPSQLETEDVEYVIAHEKVHIGRKDHMWKPLAFLLLAVYWFHPLVWIAYILFGRDLEFACDEAVICQMGAESKKPYSNALINCNLPRKRIAACPLAFGEVGVKRRIKSVLNYKKPAFWLILLAVIACVGLAVGFLTDPTEKIEGGNVESASPEVLEELRNKYPQYFDLETMKGLHVYVWQMAKDTYYCSLLPGGNIGYESQELWHLDGATIEEMKIILSTYDIPKSDIAIIPIQMPYSSYFYQIDTKYYEKLERLFWGETVEILEDLEENSCEEWGLTMDMRFKTATTFEVVFYHDSKKLIEEGGLTTGEWYEIRAVHEGKAITFGNYMRDVLGKEYEDKDWSFFTLAYIIDDGETVMDHNLEYSYGELPAGEYLLYKKVYLEKEQGEYEEKILSVRFFVTD